jgi:hypothetical protein
MPDLVIDMHVHVGLKGDVWPQWGGFSEKFLNSLSFHGLLLYGRMQKQGLTDRTIHDATLKAIDDAKDVDRVVCLALDPAFTEQGASRVADANMWVANEYVLQLQKELPEKVLFGASVHPYDPAFKTRVKKNVEQGAVLLKWLPSVQAIDLADDRVVEALKFLATAKNGKPLPLLLHVGSEFSIDPIEHRTKSYNFLSWKLRDRIRNLFSGQHLERPRDRRVRANLRAGLDAGAVIIFAHCGLPYFLSGRLGKWLEHSDFSTVRWFLRQPAFHGRAFADVSAILTPFRHPYFKKLNRLPPASLVLGSDWPVPIFPLPMDLEQDLEDLADVIEGRAGNIVPQGNLIDVNRRELQTVFGPGHPLFTNFAALM